MGNEKILITDGAGYIVCILIPAFLNRNYEVTVVELNDR